MDAAGVPVTPRQGAGAAAAAPDATHAADHSDRPLSTPLPLPFSNRPSIARSRDSSIRLRRLTSTSQSSDAGPPTATDQDALALQPLSPGRHGYGSQHQQLTCPPHAQQHREPLSPSGSHLSPDLRHVTFLSQVPGDRNSAPARPDHVAGPVAPVVNLRAAQPIGKHPDKHDRKERMAMFGRRRIRPEVNKDDATDQSDDDQDNDQNKRQRQRSSLPLYGAGGDYGADIVDMLDVIDPEVSTMSSITNVQNSLFVPSLGRFVNRRPTFNLTPYPRGPDSPVGGDDDSESSPIEDLSKKFEREDRNNIVKHKKTPSADKELPPLPRAIERIPSVLTDTHFAVRPSDTSLAHWSDQDLADLNDHVRHMLHSRRSKVGRRLRAFGQYVSRPMGFFVTLYASIIILLGTAWVVFLIGWIYVGDEQSVVIGTINIVLVTLFSLVGIGLIPWRAVDTYHMLYIVRLEHLARKRLDEAGSSTTDGTHPTDVEAGHNPENNKGDLTSALTAQQRASLEHHQSCFAKSHTFYKPHDSETHHAFPVRLLIAIVILLDGNSAFQLALALCTWSIRYRYRPMALTVSLLCCAMACNICAGILISVGDKRTRKKDAVERMWRQELTREAIRRKEKKTAKQAEERKRALLERVKEEEESGGGRTSSQWLRKSLDVVRGREISLIS
ncbi:hypothetical protein Micbo1qcDRAFT_151662 [Microdochium bolleyi]|uniref:Integral membrane protein n=1 Tax=Microdochium bolleyi TaxID=196109 RepID=A0A136ISA3_9PEZI|nr:hypothetical protein Micbo1qcDRAFT_151662 [Microdochium bolleyi]